MRNFRLYCGDLNKYITFSLLKLKSDSEQTATSLPSHEDFITSHHNNHLRDGINVPKN
jgi:hypothetical protein